MKTTIIMAGLFLLLTGEALALDCPQIYWYSGQSYAGLKESPRTLEEIGSGDTRFFDGTKPSIIYFHGAPLTKDNTTLLTDAAGNITFNSSEITASGFDIGWLKTSGYNVGVFFWKSAVPPAFWWGGGMNYSAYEYNLWAGAKTPTCNTKGKQQRDLSVVDHFEKEYVSLWQRSLCNYSCGSSYCSKRCQPLQLVAHSNGGQLAVSALERVRKYPDVANSLVLLEPQWFDSSTILGKMPSTLTWETIKRMVQDSPPIATQIAMGNSTPMGNSWSRLNLLSKPQSEATTAKRNIASAVFDFFINGEVVNGSFTSWGDPISTHNKLVSWWFSKYSSMFNWSSNPTFGVPSYPDAISPQCGVKRSTVCNGFFCTYIYPWLDREQMVKGDKTLWYRSTKTPQCTTQVCSPECPAGTFQACSLDDNLVPIPGSCT